jgi:RNase H-fold protein (predicted Holliday junction resolvase)
MVVSRGISIFYALDFGAKKLGYSFSSKIGMLVA